MTTRMLALLGCALILTACSDVVKAALAKSKFKDVPGFGDKIKGHLLLTNHKDEAWYRNLRIRELPAK